MILGTLVAIDMTLSIAKDRIYLRLCLRLLKPSTNSAKVHTDTSRSMMIPFLSRDSRFVASTTPFGIAASRPSFRVTVKEYRAEHESHRPAINTTQKRQWITLSRWLLPDPPHPYCLRGNTKYAWPPGQGHMKNRSPPNLNHTLTNQRNPP